MIAKDPSEDHRAGEIINFDYVSFCYDYCPELLLGAPQESCSGTQ
jgi:hypothetical protein